MVKIINILMAIFIVIVISPAVYSQDEDAVKNAALDKGDPLYPSDIDGLGKEDLIKAGYDVVNPSYPNNIEGLTKEELIKRGFDKDNNTQEDFNESKPANYGGDVCQIGAAVDNQVISWDISYENSICNWIRQTGTYYFDGDSARSTTHRNFGQSSMQTQVSGSGTVSFFWSVSSEYGYDVLDFYIDGVRKDRISGFVPWQYKSYYVGRSGTHTLKWIYIKDVSISVGQDSGFVDKFEWTGNIMLRDALDTSHGHRNDILGNGYFDTYGDANWFGQTTTYITNGAAAQSGSIGHDMATTMSFSYIDQGRLSFYWKVSSEYNYDFLEFYINGVLKDRISGNIPWQKKTYDIPPGTGINTLSWKYKKDGSVSIGSDAGWVDYIDLKPSITLYSQPNYAGRTKTFYADTPWVGSNFDNIASSIDITMGYCTRLFDYAWYGGAYYDTCQAKENLAWYGFDDKISSLKLYRGW